MGERTCPGWRDDGTFHTDTCSQDYYDAEGPDDCHVIETECRCTNVCGDPGDGAGCCYCNHTDIYEPCPVVGFGCGWQVAAGVSDVHRCDCCSDAEWNAAAGLPVTA